jgi:two-component system LytT family sensor kinase
MKQAVNRKKITFYIWVGLAYLTVWILHISTNPLFSDTVVPRIWNETWRAAYFIVANYIFFEYCLPFLKLTWKRILLCIVLFVPLLFLFGAGLYLWRELGIALHIQTPLKVYKSVGAAIGERMSSVMAAFIFNGILKHIYDYIQLKNAAKQLRIEKQEAELNYLKSQTNPHFLFNTLNNIYSLAKDKSDLAPESILRLSKIMRFMLYESGKEYIAVEEELKIISDYISLEKLRYDESLRVNFNYQIENPHQSLPPLLLIPLVENAFKHGVSETRDQPYVDIQLIADRQYLKFIVKNSTEESAPESTVKENIGLSNLRRQLELLYTDFELSIIPSPYVFTASLKINLTSHV